MGKMGGDYMIWKQVIFFIFRDIVFSKTAFPFAGNHGLDSGNVESVEVVEDDFEKDRSFDDGGVVMWKLQCLLSNRMLLLKKFEFKTMKYKVVGIDEMKLYCDYVIMLLTPFKI